MAEFSVPTSLLGSSDLLTDPDGVQIDGQAPVDVTANPVICDPDIEMQIDRTIGTTSLVDCVDDTNTDKFMTYRATGTRSGINVNIAFTCQAVTDPGIDTDHKINLLIRRNGALPETTYAVALGLYTGSDLISASYFNLIQDLIPTDFTLITINLTEAEVQDFRSKNGYAAPVFWMQFGVANELENPMTSTWDIALFQLEVPDSDPSDGIIASGGAGANPEFEEEITGGIEVGDDETEVILLENQFVEASGGAGDNESFIDEILGGIEFFGSPLIILSTDPSGIYTLVPGQHYDTLYTRNTTTNETTIVAIPTPFIKTGFIGG